MESFGNGDAKSTMVWFLQFFYWLYTLLIVTCESFETENMRTFLMKMIDIGGDWTHHRSVVRHKCKPLCHSSSSRLNKQRGASSQVQWHCKISWCIVSSLKRDCWNIFVSASFEAKFYYLANLGKPTSCSHESLQLRRKLRPRLWRWSLYLLSAK